MNMNMQNLLAQAKKIQNEMENATKTIENTVFEGTAANGDVKVEILGNNTVKTLLINNEEIMHEKEILEDYIIIAINDALCKIKDEKNAKLGKYTNGLGGMF